MISLNKVHDEEDPYCICKACREETGVSARVILWAEGLDSSLVVICRELKRIADVLEKNYRQDHPQE